MKNLFFLLTTIFFVINVFAFEEGLPTSSVAAFPPKLHEKYGLAPNMTIQATVEIMDIPLNDFKDYFRLNLRDPRIDSSTLNSHSISIDDVYQLYCMTKYNFNDFSTLYDVSQILNMPFKSVAEFLNLNAQDASNRNKSIRDLGLETLDMPSYYERFKSEKHNFISVLTVLGMTVTFSALILIVIIVSRLTLMDRKTQKKISTSSPIGTISSVDPGVLNFEDAVVAIIASIHKFKSEIALDHKILLTYRRIDVSMWQASGKLEMPNKHYKSIKK